jgi:hypothetical protein
VLSFLHDFHSNISCVSLAGTAWGCSDKVSQGAEPNEYGTWWYGRGNWCDGMDVKPLVTDVTDSIYFDGAENSVDYEVSEL